MSLTVEAPALSSGGAQAGTARAYYYSVGTVKLVVLTICTLGLYQFVWHYRNWKAHEAISGERLTAWLRAIFSPVMFFGLASELEQPDADTPAAGDFSGKPVAFAYLFCNVLWRLPNPWWILGLTSVIPLALAQRQIDRYTPPEVRDARRRFGLGSVFTLAFGLILWLLIVIGMTVPNPPE